MAHAEEFVASRMKFPEPGAAEEHQCRPDTGSVKLCKLYCQWIGAWVENKMAKPGIFSRSNGGEEAMEGGIAGGD